MSRCQVCDSHAASVADTDLVPAAGAERLILDLLALVGVRVTVHRVRLVECPDCVPGRIVRRRYVEIPLEQEYAKGYLRDRSDLRQHFPVSGDGGQANE